MKKPQPNEVWQNRNGKFYQVLHLVNQNSKDHASFSEAVVYENTNTKEKFSRPLSTWDITMSFHSKDLHK